MLAVDNIVKMAEANGTDKDKIAVAKEISEKCKSPEIEKEYVESDVQPNIISISNGFLLCFIQFSDAILALQLENVWKLKPKSEESTWIIYNYIDVSEMHEIAKYFYYIIHFKLFS